MHPQETEPSSLRGALAAVGLFVLVACVLLVGSARIAVFDRDEARFALAVREMRAHDEYLLPTNWGEPRYHKPILAYWLALASERVLGPGEFAWRLPSAVAGLVALGATVALARRRFGQRVALRAGAILGTSLVFVVETRILTADALLLATTTLAFWAWLELHEARGRAGGWRLLFWSALGFGLLAKGVNVAFLAAAAGALAWLEAGRPRAPLVLFLLATCAAAVPALGFLGPVLFALACGWTFVVARRPARVRLGAAWGVPLCLALLGLWFVPALVRSSGAFLSEGVGHHLLARTGSAFEGHRGFPGYYMLAALLVLFPWAAWLPAALTRAWREPGRAFLLAWVLGPWALIECMASKLPHYLLVTLPALALLVALEWERRSAGGASRERRERRLEPLLFALPCLLLVAAAAWLAWSGAPGLRAPALVLGGVALGLGAVGVPSARRADGRPFVVAFVGASALYLILCGWVLPTLEPLRLSKPLGRELARRARPSEPIYLVHFRPASLGCYLPPGHAVVEDQAEANRVLAEPRPGLYVMESERVERATRAHPQAFERLVALPGLAAFGAEEVVVLRVAGGAR